MTHRGLTGAGREVVTPLVLGAWDAFLGVAQGGSTSSGGPGCRDGDAHDVCVHLGVRGTTTRRSTGWSRRPGPAGPSPVPDVDAANARVTSAPRAAPRAEVLAALERHRDAVRAYLTDVSPRLDDAPTPGPVGVLPLLTTILAEAYELAVHALDLRDAGAGDPPPALLDAGLAALAEVTGALAAAHGVRGGAAPVPRTMPASPAATSACR